MKTDVHSLGRFSAMAEHFRKMSQNVSSSNIFVGQTKTQGGGRWSAMRNHLIDQADADAKRTTPFIHPKSIRFVG